ncbi:MAG: menaquinone reductase multiheme cytochrome c subunit QrcA [Desulfovibrionaceae bacterium]
MEDRNTAGSSGKHCSCHGGAAPFVVGIVAALILGWWVFPNMLFSEKIQPIRFSHKVHMDGAGMACDDCHSYREDGSFAGLPKLAQCAECHEEAQGEDPEELRFIEDYVHTGKEVDWKVYQYQPDNVFFSHAAHNKAVCGQCHSDFEESPKALCNNCHPDVAESDAPPVFKENKLTGYSSMTMKMWQCEQCHANENHFEYTDEDRHNNLLPQTRANNGCQVCHK